MTAMAPVAIDDIPPIGRAEATSLAAAEYARFAELLRALPPHAWDLPTDCTRWTVKDVAAHVVGATEAFASAREFVHQWAPAGRVRREVGSPWRIDGVNEVQVRDRRTAPPAELIARLVAAAPRAARARARLPRPLRACRCSSRRRSAAGRRLPRPRDHPGRRMHRVDIARAAGVTVLTAGTTAGSSPTSWPTGRPPTATRSCWS